MSKGLLSKLFGGVQAEDGHPELSQALEELPKVRQQRPSLAPACAMMEEILPALFGVPVEASSSLNPARIVARLEQGIPLMRGEKVICDNRALQKRWLAVCAAIARQHGRQEPTAPAPFLHGNTPVDNLGAAFADLDVPALFIEVLAGRPEAMHERADALQLDTGLTATVFRLAVFPVLAKITSSLAHLCRTQLWDQGCCPVCGTWPLLAELRGLEQNRFLRCGVCASDWQFPRLRCPFCGNRDHRQLSYFYVQREENRCRVATCDACSGYVKTVATLAPLTAPQLLVTDVATLHLDLAAADRGYVVT